MTADRGISPGADPAALPEVLAYLDRLRAASRGLPSDRVDDVIADVREHVRRAVAAAPGDPTLAARDALDRLGSPEDVARAVAEESGVAAAGRAELPWMNRYGEPLAIFLLLFGGFVFVVGWLVGAALLWLSSSWRLREKLLGTLVWPFGYLSVGFAGTVVGFVESCTSTSTAAGDLTRTCTGGAPYPAWVGVLLGIVVVAAPIGVAVLLWRRRRAVLDGRA